MKKSSAYRWFWNAVCTTVRFLITLRYRIEVSGLETLTSDRLKRPGGILFLPNHPAEIDPVILISQLGKRFYPRPLVTDRFYNQKGINFFMQLANALPLPSTDGVVNHWRAKKIHAQLQTLASALKKGDNFLIYPSGRLKLSGTEMIGGASLVHDLLQECPETNVVLIRTTGLWGSQFSRAITGASPDFGLTLWNCFKILIKNGIFFTPRRPVRLEFVLAPQDFPYEENRLNLNKYLEEWYNRYPDPVESLQLVPYFFWSQKLPKAAVLETPSSSQIQKLKKVPLHVEQEIIGELSRLTKRPVEQIRRNMHLSHDLGLDSLDVAQLYVYLSERFAAHKLLPGDLQTVEDVCQAAVGLEWERGPEDKAAPTSFTWQSEPNRPPPMQAQGKTLQEAFLFSCDRMKGHSACVDALSGCLSYTKLKMAALILAEQMRALPGKQIGVMLPASTGTYLVILGVLLAGKVPVMINWTSGVKALDYAMSLAELSVVVSSDRFLDRLETGSLGQIEEKFVLMEQIRQKITLTDKLRGLMRSLCSAASLRKTLKLDAISPDDPAVILFTSGTESLPKGVPLSHHNLLSNQRAALACVEFHSDDILYGVLPPFHSFGFSVTGLLPILAGMKSCYAPNPTDSRGLAHDIALWKPTLFCCAPSFFRSLFHIATPQQLQSLRYVVAGAEKTPEEIFAYVKEHLPQALCLEGYGITECGPIVTLTRPLEARVGVGRPLPGTELTIIDPEGHLLPQGEEGEVCIRGPNVFAKYLGNPRTPFVVINQEKWYASSDRGKLDAEGNLILSGRLKRFIKIGGEMVSLGGIEDELLKQAHIKGWIPKDPEGPPLAVSVREGQGEKPSIILYVAFPISIDEVNQALKETGWSRLVKISEVKQIAEIPLTGTGKTHYRQLDENLG